MLQPGSQSALLEANGADSRFSLGVDQVFRALCDPVRRGLLDRLCRGPASVSELAKPPSMSLSAVVQHLQELEGRGLVRTQKQGRVRTCQIEIAALRRAERWIFERRSKSEHRF